jgi:hypothetical protein
MRFIFFFHHFRWFQPVTVPPSLPPSLLSGSSAVSAQANMVQDCCQPAKAELDIDDSDDTSALTRWYSISQIDMNGTVQSCQCSFTKCLAVCGMRVDRSQNLVGGKLSTHCEREFADEVCSVRTEDSGTQNLAILTKDDLGKTLSFIGRQRFAVRYPGELFRMDDATAVASLFLRQTD